MKRVIVSLPIILFFAINTGFSQKLNVIEFGAVGDGKSMNTFPIQNAIDECHKTGGTVILPPGVFLSGTLFLKDNVTLEVMSGAILKGSPEISDYPEIISEYRSYTDNYVRHSLIYAEKADHIAITGSGIIDGNGDAPAFATGAYLVRPYVIRFIRCSNVKVEGVSLVNSPMWMQHYLACKKLFINNIDVYNHVNYNNDGLDIDGCEDVIISNSFFDSDDDAICFKSSGTASCENIIVSNCVVSSHCNAIKCGTETTGGFKNISISNCVVRPSKDDSPIYGVRQGQSAIALEIVDGGTIDGIMISNMSIDGVQTPVFIRLGNRARKYMETANEPNVGVLKNVHINNIMARNAGVISSSITGIPEYLVENINLTDITIISNGGGKTIDVSDVIENDQSYPSPSLFECDLPSFGFYVRHAKNIYLRNVNLVVNENDERAAIVFDDVINGEIWDLRTAGLSGEQKQIWLNNSRKIKMNEMEEKVMIVPAR